MKKIILLFIFSLQFMIIHSSAQAPSWLWANGEGGTAFDSSTCITVDGSDNSFVTGTFNSPSITFGTTTLSNAGGQDIFVVKYDAAGNVIWATGGGGSGNDYGFGIAVDANGNSYVTGRFQSSSITFGATTLTNAGSGDIFIVKYDAAGNVAWAKSSGGSNNDYGTDIDVDGSGNSYVTGTFLSPSITFDTTTLTNAGGTDIFRVKYDIAGNVIWATSSGGSGNEMPNDLAVDDIGNSYVTGYFNSSFITFGTTTLSNFGNDDIFIVKYDTAGIAVWAKGVGGSNWDWGYGIEVDGSGNCYVTGTFSSSTITFGPTTLSTNGNYDVFIVKYDVAGIVKWATSAGGLVAEQGFAIAVDGQGNSYVTGSFASPSITFDTTTLTLTGVGGTDIFIVKYDAAGNVVWATSAGGNLRDNCLGIAVDSDGNSYVAGCFQSASITFGTSTLVNGGNSDVFIARLASTAVTVPEIESGGGLIVFPNPVTAQLRIQSANFKIDNIEIYNPLGEKVYEKIIMPYGLAGGIPGKLEMINVSSLTPGTYFVRVRTAEEMDAKKPAFLTARFIKQ